MADLAATSGARVSPDSLSESEFPEAVFVTGGLASTVFVALVEVWVSELVVEEFVRATAFPLFEFVEA